MFYWEIYFTEIFNHCNHTACQKYFIDPQGHQQMKVYVREGVSTCCHGKWEQRVNQCSKRWLGRLGRVCVSGGLVGNDTAPEPITQITAVLNEKSSLWHSHSEPLCSVHYIILCCNLLFWGFQQLHLFYD